DRENITVTREGVDERFLAPGPTDPPPGWPDSYVLYVGSLAPRKNLASLLEAYAGARAQGVQEPLVLAGAGAPDYVAALRSEAVALGIIEDVIFSGYLADDLLPAAYANARAFVYLSLDEGFGLPILEAMACGTPVIASASSCFPEIVGDAGVLVEPRDVQAQARALVELLTDESKRQELAAKSRERARQFSWRDAAAQTLDVYLRASGER
ncbi:MAG: glycosyltransferase family 4 protein, partial [Armatimonadota bacterium]